MSNQQTAFIPRTLSHVKEELEMTDQFEHLRHSLPLDDASLFFRFIFASALAPGN